MNREILRLAIPNILTNLTIPLLGMVDLHLMGYQDSEVFMGAVALGSVIFNIVYWSFAFLRMSLSGLAAQAYGRSNNNEMAMMLFRGLFLALSGAFVLLVFQSSIVQFSLFILEGSEEVKELARVYFNVRIWAAPAAIALMVLYGWFLGMQNAVYPMIISICVNVVNISCSFFLVKFIGMQVEGVALGSVVAQYLGLILAIFLFLKKYRYILAEFSFKEVIRRSALAEFLNVSGDIFLRTFCIIIVFTFFTSKSAGASDIILAANSALLQFLFLFSYFLDGFACAAEALVGKFAGRMDIKTLRRAVRVLMVWGAGFGLLFTGAYLVGGFKMLKIYTNQPEVITTAASYLPWLVILPLTGFASFIWDGVYIGATASKLMRNTMLVATFLFFACYLAFRGIIENHALWLAMNMFMLGRGLLQTYYYQKLPILKAL